uniref:Uncharacterized protein n=1 Tax=Strigamia maritima TaxID=126957 RepID=T1IY79_STRMM
MYSYFAICEPNSYYLDVNVIIFKQTMKIFFIFFISSLVTTQQMLQTPTCSLKIRQTNINCHTELQYLGIAHLNISHRSNFSLEHRYFLKKMVSKFFCFVLAVMVAVTYTIPIQDKIKSVRETDEDTADEGKKPESGDDGGEVKTPGEEPSAGETGDGGETGVMVMEGTMTPGEEPSAGESGDGGETGGDGDGGDMTPEVAGNDTTSEDAGDEVKTPGEESSAGETVDTGDGEETGGDGDNTTAEDAGDDTPSEDGNEVKTPGEESSGGETVDAGDGGETRGDGDVSTPEDARDDTTSEDGNEVKTPGEESSGGGTVNAGAGGETGGDGDEVKIPKEEATGGETPDKHSDIQSKPKIGFLHKILLVPWTFIKKLFGIFHIHL